MAELGHLLGKPKEAKTFAPDSRWVLPKSLIGMEHEYEGMAPHLVSKLLDSRPILRNSWETHQENSLKNAGVEFAFRTPMFGRDAYKAIESLVEAAKEYKLICSLRAGIHVHIDVRDIETSQLIGMTILYAILEPLIFKWIGDNRENSIFCIPFYKADESLLETCELVSAVLEDEKEHQGKATEVSKKISRYAAYNLNALSKFGSIEFRHMKTTHNFARIIDWINIIMSLKAATQKLPTSDGAIIQLAKTSSAPAFLDYIFGGALAAKLWHKDAHELIQDVGIPSAQDLVLYGLSTHEWNEVDIPDGKFLGFANYLKTPRKADSAPKEKKMSSKSMNSLLYYHTPALSLQPEDAAQIQAQADQLYGGLQWPAAPQWQTPAMEPQAETVTVGHYAIALDTWTAPPVVAQPMGVHDPLDAIAAQIDQEVYQEFLEDEEDDETDPE